MFTDSEVSGGVWLRDGLQALLAAVETGRVRRIFVEDLSRLSRDKEDAARIEKLLAYHEVSVATLDGMVYDGSVGSSLAFTFQSAGAAQYLQELGAKTRRGPRGTSNRQEHGRSLLRLQRRRRQNRSERVRGKRRPSHLPALSRRSGIRGDRADLEREGRCRPARSASCR